MSRALLSAAAAVGTTVLLLAAMVGQDGPGGFRALVVLVPVVVVAGGTWLGSVGTTSAGLLGAAVVVAVPLIDRVVPATVAAAWAVALAVVVEVSLQAARSPAPPHMAWGSRVRGATPLLVAVTVAPVTATAVAWVTAGSPPPQLWAVVTLALAAGAVAAIHGSLTRSSGGVPVPKPWRRGG